MKKTSIFFAIATIALLSACRKENFNATESTPGAVTVIGVGINDVKTTMGAPVEGTRKIYWANGDVLQANDLTSAALADLPEECTSARFTFDGTLTYPANLLYPADYYKDESTITLPLEQPVTPKVALYGYMDEEGDAQMNALLAYVHIPLTQGEDKDEIKAMTVESLTDGYCLSGDFTIDYETGALTPAAEASKKVSVLFNKPLNPEKATDFFAAVPAGENVKLSVKFKDVKGHCMTKTVTRTFVAGTVTSLPNTEFVPTTTEFDVVITTAAQWNTYAESFNANPAEHQTDIVAINNDLDFDGITNVFIGSHYGGEDYVSGSILGNNHKIMNLHSSVPLVGSVNSKGEIKDLTIDSSCSFTVPYTVGADGYFGPFAEYVKGEIDNCHNEASITISSNGKDFDKNIFIGGLAGRVREGKLVNCTNSGDITLDATFKGTGKSYAGGIVGYMSNAAAVVDSCSNSGKITTAALTNTTVLAGIGANVSGTISNCENTGELTSSMTRPSGDACKFIMIGGIAGTVNKDMTLRDNSNKVDITVSDAVKQNSIGGIAAQIAGSGTTLSGNTNSGNISSTAGIRNAYFGGLYGQVSATTSITLTGSPFTGKISISGHESKDAVYLFAGGIVGLSTAELTITGDNCTLESDITIPQSSSTAVELFMGGVVGAAGENGGATVVSGAKVTVSGISVSGKIKMTGSDNTIVPLYKKAAFGGILGAAFAGADISNCESTTDVYFCEGSTASGSNGNPAHLGGIAGRIEGANSKISNCTAGGKVYSYLYNNNWWNANNQVGINAVGGIVGSFGYNKDQTYTLVLSDCSSSATCYGYRGTVGGIAGYLDKATLSGKNSFTGSISRGAPAAGVAGIANECAISGCTVKSSKIAGSGAGSCIGHTAGIVGLGMSTSVDDCKSFVSTLTAAGTNSLAGGIIASPDANCSIGNTTACSYGGSVGGTTITSGNVANYAIGNTAISLGTVNYWNGK